MRTIIDLPEEQLEALRKICERDGISRAEAIRRLIAEALNDADRKREQRKEAIRAAFGLWKGRGIDAVEYQRKLRSEWDREWDVECEQSSTPTS